MENNPNYFIALAYKLYVDGEKEQELMEEATEKTPFQFISGFGFTLDEFEKNVIAVEKGQDFDFLIPKEQAYGDYMEEHVIDMDREIFCIDGKFDSEHIYEDAVIPLQNEDGNHFYGRVVEIGSEKIKVDLNHPLAGEDLHFVGRVIENRPATKEEIDRIIAHMTHSGCGGSCDDCSGGCGNCGGHCH